MDSEQLSYIIKYWLAPIIKWGIVAVIVGWLLFNIVPVIVRII